MRSVKREARGISPVIATILLIAVTAVAGGIIAAYVAGLYVPFVSQALTAEANGTIFDTDNTGPDSFWNGKCEVQVTILSDDLDDILDSADPMIITLSGQGKGWTTGAIDLRATSGKTEANYGETIDVDGILDVSGMDNDLYIRITIPTTSTGQVDKGMSISVNMWPTMDATAEAINDAISAAPFDNKDIADDWWDERDTINIVISARSDALTLTSFDGAYLFGKAIDKV